MAARPTAKTRGFLYDPVNDRLHLYHGTTLVMDVRSTGLQTALVFTVSAGGIVVTGNSTITGTLGGLTGLTVASGTVSLPAGTILQAALEEGSVKFIDVQLTDTNVKALNGTPITLIAAPGSNKATVVHRVWIVVDAGSGAYVEPDAPDDLMIEYADGVDIFAAGVIEATALIAASVKGLMYEPLGTAVVADVNAVVRIVNPNSDWTGGNANNTMSIRLWYSTVDTVAFS